MEDLTPKDIFKPTALFAFDPWDHLFQLHKNEANNETTWVKVKPITSYSKEYLKGVPVL